MNQALKAMVEAMALAFQDQAGERYPEATRTVQDPGLIFLNGDFDLEKVARAGLAALRSLPEELFDAGSDHVEQQWSLEPGEGLDGLDVEPAWTFMIDAILKDTP